MPRYFFHVQDGKDIPDEEGTELSSDNAAKTEAVVVAGGLLAELGSDFWNGGDWRLQVVREDGEQICELEFSATTGQPVL
jgi:hypothetical protein